MTGPHRSGASPTRDRPWDAPAILEVDNETLLRPPILRGSPCAPPANAPWRTLGLRRDDDHATRVDPVDLAVEPAVYALEAQTGGREHPDQLGQRVEAAVVPVPGVAAGHRGPPGGGRR